MNPLTIFLISQAVGTGLNLFGASKQEQANKAAASSQQAYNQQLLDENERQNRFQEGIQRSNLALSKEAAGIAKNRFAMDREMQDYNISQAEISKLEKLMKNNFALRQQLISNWS